MVVEPEREIPVERKVDVIVAGGGPAGLAAAVAAARIGVEVLLVERYSYLGGMATGGMVIRLYETARYGHGISKEVLKRLSDMKAARLHQTAGGPAGWREGTALSGEEAWSFDPEALKFVAEEMLSESGVTLLLHSFVVDAVREGRTVKGVIVEGKSGRHAFLSDVVVDATGDGDVAAASGASYRTGKHPWGVNLDFRLGNVDLKRNLQWKDDNPQSYEKLMGKLETEVGKIRWSRHVRDDVVWGLTPRNFWVVDALDDWELTRVGLECRRIIMKGVEFLKANMPGFEDAFLIDTGPQIGVRETRRIVGEYTLTKEDIMNGKRFDDAISSGPFDIPYRCLVPREVDGLLVSGRCISTTQDALGSVRNIPPCFVTGQAAGTAAALAVKKGVKPRRLNVSLLKETLKEKGG